jgi:hypothetical protein
MGEMMRTEGDDRTTHEAREDRMVLLVFLTGVVVGMATLTTGTALACWVAGDHLTGVLLAASMSLWSLASLVSLYVKSP